MSGDILRDLARLHRYAKGLAGLMTEAGSRLPHGVEGSDKTGAVWVVLGPDGLPESFRIESDWRNALDPAGVGDAVVDASRVAANQRMAAWTRALDDEGWTARAGRLRADLDERSESDDDVVVLPAEVRQAGPRAVQLLAEDVLAELDIVGGFTGPPTMIATGTGSDRGNRVSIVVSASGLRSCAVDPGWARQQSGSALKDALDEALAAARLDLAAAVEQAPDPAARLDGLLGEALALLADPQRLANS